MKDRITSVADILMAAAHADRNLHGAEKETVRRLLSEIWGTKALPGGLSARIDGFAPARFDLTRTVAAFQRDPADKKLKLMQLVSAVHHSDDEYDLDEDAFLRDLGQALGLAPDRYKDLVLEFTEEPDLRGVMEEVRFGPEGD
jgi:uncharacterized tellurite resistance protein B-like protein